MGQLGRSIDNGRLEGGGEIDLGNALCAVQLIEHLLPHGFQIGVQRMAPLLKDLSHRR